MSWKKHFTVHQSNNKNSGKAGKEGYNSRFQSWLPEVYTGMPNRTERYMQYDQMDMDSEINMALDTIAEFATQIDEKTASPFQVNYKSNPTESEAKIIEQSLKQWCNINDWDRRIFRTFRNVIKYGDQPFIRDPETWELLYVNPQDVMGAVINESEGKEAEQYIIKELDLNIRDKTASAPLTINKTTGGISPTNFTKPNNATINTTYGSQMAYGNNEEVYVDSSHIVHIAMTEGMDGSYPFGASILDPIFKTYKQKELLEDAIIIYRVQRAPERRVFYIDIGDMPQHRANSFLEKVKMEVHQKRIPNKTGGGSTIMDAQYSPLSMLEDYFFAQCLSLDTKISMLDGRSLTLEQIIEEHKQGKENYVYGLSNKTFEMEPAKIKWAGVTRKDAQVLKITLDNGETVTATPDHQFILRDGSEVEAQHLKIDDSLMPLELIDGYSGPNQKNKKYQRYRSNSDGKIKFVHATVSGKPSGKDTQVHHIDFDSKNNNPTNLQIMKTEDHIQLHRELGTYSINEQWSNKESREKLIAGMRKLYDNRNEDFNEMLSQRNSKNAKAFWENPENIEKQKSSLASLKKTQNQVSSARKINFTIDMTTAMIGCFDGGANSISKLMKELPNNKKFIKAYMDANKNRKVAINETDMISVRDSTLNSMVAVIGYDTFGEWKSEYTGLHKFSNKSINRKNHKVAKIEWLEERIDTGDITIESDSDSHWFGLSSGIYVHNSPDGRGSKVEVLPGGDNLGEISDLQFFTDKMMRGLRIPSSYMPMAHDDSGPNFTDGRVGTSFIQEFRFNKYCMRLQNIIQPVFDREFKRFMKHRGFNIDSSIFDLRFAEPQSFSDYRQIELDSAKAGVFGQVEGTQYLSRRFVLKRYLGLTDDEILENERLYFEENSDKIDDLSIDPNLGGGAGMDDMGFRTGDFDSADEFGADEFGADEFGADELGGIGGEGGAVESPITGNEGSNQNTQGTV